MTSILSALDVSSNQQVAQWFSDLNGSVTTLEHRDHFREHVLKQGGYEALIVGFKEMVDEAVLNAQPNLKVIGTLSTGVDHIDMGLCEQYSIKVITAKSINAYAVAEHTLAQLFYFLKLLPESHRACLEGSDRAGLPEKTRDIKNLKVGILGTGATAQELAKRVSRFRS